MNQSIAAPIVGRGLASLRAEPEFGEFHAKTPSRKEGKDIEGKPCQGENVLLFYGKKMDKKMLEADCKKMNLPLPREMHEAIFTEARGMGMPATRLVRMVLDNWLRERRRARRREKVREFALAAAGTALDLDPELESAATEELERFYETEEDAAR